MTQLKSLVQNLLTLMGSQQNTLAASSPGDKNVFLCVILDFYIPSWGQGVLEMILNHMAPFNLNMSPHRAIWTKFSSNSMIFTKKCLVLDLVQDLDPVQVLEQE